MLTLRNLIRLPKGGWGTASIIRRVPWTGYKCDQSVLGEVFAAVKIKDKIFPSAGASDTSSIGLLVDLMYPTYVMMPWKSYCGAKFYERVLSGWSYATIEEMALV